VRFAIEFGGQSLLCVCGGRPNLPGRRGVGRTGASTGRHPSPRFRTATYLVDTVETLCILTYLAACLMV